MTHKKSITFLITGIVSLGILFLLNSIMDKNLSENFLPIDSFLLLITFISIFFFGYYSFDEKNENDEENDESISDEELLKFITPNLLEKDNKNPESVPTPTPVSIPAEAVQDQSDRRRIPGKMKLSYNDIKSHLSTMIRQILAKDKAPHL